MNVHISNASSKGEWCKTSFLYSALSTFLAVVVFFGIQLVGPSIVEAAVTIAPTTQINDHLVGQDDTTDFIQSFYATGTNSQNINFVGIYWPTASPSQKTSTSTIGQRAANTSANTKTEITLDIPYGGNYSSITPGTTYEYEIRDSQDISGTLYYKGSFTSPGTPAGPPPGKGLNVSTELSSDGRTVYFNVTGKPENNSDVNFSLSYSTSANSTYKGTVDAFATRKAATPETTLDTFQYTLGKPGQMLTDDQGFLIDPATVSYNLTDRSDGKVFVSGSFAADPALAGGASTGSTTAATTTGSTAVVPKPAPKPNIIKDNAPDLSGGLVPCDGRSNVNACSWNKLIQLINKVLTWLILMTVPIAAAMFAYAGFLFLTKGTSEEARGKAKGIFINVFIGLIFVVAAVLIIKTVLLALLDPSVGDGYSSFL